MGPILTIQNQTAALSADTIELCGTSLYGGTASDASQIVEITYVVIRDSSNNEYSCSPISRSTYLNYTVKTSGGRPTQYYFEKTINPFSLQFFLFILTFLATSFAANISCE